MTQRQQRIVRKQRRKPNKARQSYPHDSLFKKVFKRPEYCRSLLQVLLRPSFYVIFDWSLLKISESITTGAKGEERRADIVLEVPLLNSKFRVIITIILEHKSYRDNNAILQMLGYYNEIAQETGGIILPIIVTCCKDKQASISSDYLSWALQQQGAPEELKKQFRNLPNFHCLVVNLHDLSYRRMRRGGEAVSLALFGMRNYWDMDEEVVVKILEKAHLLPQQEREFVLSVLMDYYECADKGYGRKWFARVERKRFPHLKEEERLVPTMEFGFDRAKQQGMRQGMRKGKQLGIERGKQLGIERGKQLGIERGKQLGIERGKQLGIEQGKLEMVKRFLQAGFDEQDICKAAQLSKQQLTQIKRNLNQD